jgi:hypothetical protein
MIILVYETGAEKKQESDTCTPPSSALKSGIIEICDVALRDNLDPPDPTRAYEFR